MRAQEYVELLVEAERQFPVDSWRWNNIDVWPILRIGLGFRLDDHAGTYVNESVVYHGIQMAKDQLACLAASLRDRSHAQRKNVEAHAVLLSLTIERGFKYKDGWYNLYCDPLRSHLHQRGFETLLLEASTAGKYRIPRFSSSVFIQPALNRLAARSVLLDPCPDPINWESFNDFTLFIARNSPLAQGDVRSIVKRLTLVRRWADFFKQIFRTARPKIGFVVSYYGPLGMSFIQACRESNIPSVDLQHGVQGPGHIAYGKWHRVPQAGYSQLPSLFWCWDSDSKNTIDDWAQRSNGNHRGFVGGNPLLTEFRSPSSNLSLFFDPEVERICGNTRKNILVTLQPGDHNPILTQIIRKSPDQWFWWIRLHPACRTLPRELLQTLNFECRGRFDWKNASSLPLYALLKRMDLHVTNFSSTVIEAEKFGIPTVLLHPLGQDYYSSQIQSGMAVLGLSPDKALKSITDILSTPRHQLPLQMTVNPIELMIQEGLIRA